ncbi:hypothetical protein X777_00738 [Ooceraea biroi]|uniref:Uncharacterized protein n=1 Tax=Ooceraea biroi TaxID=2015173 RepID=A0A026WNX5_OOCBI|nr:hypothetical protein X777_00738 [Ooceraea biroi]
MDVSPNDKLTHLGQLTVSAPPSTSPSPSTTEIPKKDWELMAEMNNSVYGNPSSLTIHNEKNAKTVKLEEMVCDQIIEIRN